MWWRRSRWVEWWYGSIAVGFLLLALKRAILGERASLVGVRLVIAVGFGFLSWLEFRAGK